MDQQIEMSVKQAEYIRNANHRWNGKVGATQCGKTFIDTLYVIPSRIAERENKPGLVFIVGVSKETISRNVIEPLQELYGNKVVTSISTDNTCKILGQKVYCVGAENIGRVKKFRGPRVKYLYIDEIYDINKEVFELLKSRLSFEYSCCDFAGNPQNPQHWLEKFIKADIDIYLQRYTIFDNPFLPKVYVEQLCKEYEGTVYYNRYILGQSCNAEGIIFKQVANNKDKYITTNVGSGITTIGIDWGGNTSYHSITATRINRDFTNLQVLKSKRLKATGVGTIELFKWIIDFIKEIILKYGNVDVIYPDSAEQVLKNALIAELIKNELHIPVYDSVKTEIKDRIKAISIFFNLNKISFIKDEADTLIEALQTALFDEKAVDDRWIDDGETSDIDSLDSFAYSWTNWQKQLVTRGV